MLSTKESFVASISQVAVAPRRIVGGAQSCVRLMRPWLWTKATGRRCVSPDWACSWIAPNCCSPSGADVSMVIVMLRESPGPRMNRDGETVIDEPAGALVTTLMRCILGVTLRTVRAVVTRPGRTGTLIDGTLR